MIVFEQAQKTSLNNLEEGYAGWFSSRSMMNSVKVKGSVTVKRSLFWEEGSLLQSFGLISLEPLVL